MQRTGGDGELINDGDQKHVIQPLSLTMRRNEMKIS